MPFPQYASSTDPGVIEAVAENWRREDEFRKAALAFAALHGDAEVPRFYGGRHAIGAIASDTKPTTGEWTAGYQGRGWRPYKSNPLFKEMRSLSARLLPVPGLPDYVDGVPEGGIFWTLYPSAILVDGVAYFGLGHPVSPSQAPIGDQWSEIFASTYQAAEDAWRVR